MNRRRFSPDQMLYTRLQAGAPRPMATLLREVERCRMFAPDADREAAMIDAAINVFVLGTRAAAMYRQAQEYDVYVMRVASHASEQGRHYARIEMTDVKGCYQ